jgi:homoserine O-succinyltransferase
MPIIVQDDLPAKQILESENIFVIDEGRASHQDVRPLQILILNLMPLKEDTELDLLRALSNFPIQTQISFMKLESHTPKHTSVKHLNKFYGDFSDFEDQNFDGFIVTGAPIEQMEFEEVAYWEELKKILLWSKTHVFSTFHICWGAQAGLYLHHGIKKIALDEKLSGVYPQQVLHRKKMMMRGMDDIFFCPVSRYTGIDEEAVDNNPELYRVAGGVDEKVGSLVILAYSSRQVFVTGHSEYDRFELDKEYRRDVDKGLNPKIPVNYYPDDDPSKEPILSWRSASNCIYSNWLNFVYQGTPYALSSLPPMEEESYTLCPP